MIVVPVFDGTRREVTGSEAPSGVAAGSVLASKEAGLIGGGRHITAAPTDVRTIGGTSRETTGSEQPSGVISSWVGGQKRNRLVVNTNTRANIFGNAITDQRPRGGVA